MALLAPGLAWRAERSPELPASLRRADLVWEVERPDGQRGIVHIELQTKPEANIGWRMADYALRLWDRYHLPVLSVVVFLRPAATVPQSPFVLQWGDGERLRFDFEVVRLWDIPPERVLQSEAYFLWPLAALMGPDASAERTVEIATRLARAPLGHHERSELTSLLAVLAHMRMPPEQVMQAVRRTQMSKIFEEADVLNVLDTFLQLYTELYGDRTNGEIVARLPARVRQEVAAEVRQEGEAQGLRESIRAVLEARFGVPEADVLSALDALDVDGLKTLVPACATGSLADVRERLGLA